MNRNSHSIAFLHNPIDCICSGDKQIGSEYLSVFIELIEGGEEKAEYHYEIELVSLLV